MYRCYHSDLKIQYRTLSPTLLKPIPRSTRQRWKQKTTHSFWTPYQLHEGADANAIIFRLKAENQHLKKKLKMLFYVVQIYRVLIKAFEIKRMHIPAVRQQMQLIMRLCEHHALSKTAWRLLPFSARQWNAWTAQPICPASLQQLCRKTYPQQLTAEELNIIKNACNGDAYQNWPLCSIYFQLVRQQLLHCSISTFYKHCRLLNITRKGKKYPKHYDPIRTDKPFKILHQDITIFRTANGAKHYIYVIRDNCSRAILACRAATQYSSEIAKQTLEEVLKRHNLLHEEGILITDDGSENKGTLDEWLQKPGRLWKKVIAQMDIIQSNSMIEAANKIIKYRFLHKHVIADTPALIKLLKEAQQNFNNMPNAQLAGYTPYEVLAGAIPDYRRFAKEIKSAKIARRIANRSFNCKLVCQT